MEDRPIKVHCTEEMREHLEFVMRRYMNERIQELRHRAIASHRPQIEQDIELTRKCLEELEQAGT